MFIGRTDAVAETPILGPHRVKSLLIGKDPDAGKDWGQKEKGTTEDEMVGWHHWFYGHGFGWTPGVGDGQGGLVCCSWWSCKELDTTERLNWTETLFPVDAIFLLLLLLATSGDLRDLRSLTTDQTPVLGSTGEGTVLAIGPPGNPPIFLFCGLMISFYVYVFLSLVLVNLFCVFDLRLSCFLSMLTASYIYLL